MWFDAHNHLQDPRLIDKASLIEALQSCGVDHCVVNATCEDDWEQVEALANEHRDFILSAFGIHPWKAHTASPGWQERLKALLERYPQSSIGECGLDQWVSQPILEIQRSAFIDQVHMARELDRPLTIHCLKAWGALFDAFSEAPPPRRFLMHSFNGSIETARRLIPLGAYFSLSGYFLHERKSSIVEVFRKLPLDRILLETDAPDMLPPESIISHPLSGNHNHPANLPAIGEALAAALSIRGEALAKITSENAARCFDV
jgi:TatD DNase family protein